MALALEALGKDIQQDTIIPVCFQLVLRSEMGHWSCKNALAAGSFATEPSQR